MEKHSQERDFDKGKKMEERKQLNPEELCCMTQSMSLFRVCITKALPNGRQALMKVAHVLRFPGCDARGG